MTAMQPTTPISPKASRFSGVRLAVAAAALLLSACNSAPSTGAGDSAVNSERVLEVVPGAPAEGWASVMVKTPEGGYALGNPDAGIVLTEYASLTCPHCATFHAASKPLLLDRFVSTGQVRYEFRNFVLNGPDTAAALLARCDNGARFFALQDSFFTRQADWVAGFQNISEEQEAAIGAAPPERQLLAIAQAGGLEDWVRKLGIAKAKFESCLTDQAAISELTQLRSMATTTDQITGTPSFLLNGKKLDGMNTWAPIRAELEKLVK